MKNKIINFFSKKIMHNIGYKILSIVIAVVIWLIVINVADPVTTRTFSGLNVELRNQSAITSINQVYEVLEGNSVDFVVKGKASVIRGLDISDFHAYADLSQLSPVLATDIVVKCDVNTGIEIETKNKMLIVKLEDIKEKNYQVVVETSGQVADGYYVGEYEATPNIITVAGGVSKINQIDEIKVSVNVDDAKKSFSSKVVPVAYDVNGKEIDSTNFTFYNNGTVINDVRVNITMFKTKTIPVVLNIIGEPGEGYEYKGEYEYTPKSIKISGLPKILKKIDSIEIPVDISGASDKHEINIAIKDILPEGVKAVEPEENISVRIGLDSIVEKTIDIEAADIELRNTSELYNVVLKDADKVFSVVIKGTQEQLQEINSDTIKAYVDLMDATEGECFLQLQFEGLEDVTLASEPQLLNLLLENKNNNSNDEKNELEDTENLQ